MTEILAPCGGEDSLPAALNTGADAVYLGVTAFSARRNAKNFTYEQLEKAVDNIEIQLQSAFDREVSSDKIGELAMEQLRVLDEVAYVRFASVYRQFKDINTFMEELAKLLSDSKKK